MRYSWQQNGLPINVTYAASPMARHMPHYAEKEELNMPQLVGVRKVRFAVSEVLEFNRQWPCSELRERSYWFEFDPSGNLVDTDVPEQDDGGAALALSQDALEWLNEIDE